MNIHRCRFVPYPPQAINSIAFSHQPNPERSGRGPGNLRLAIGRANGDIEIWNPLMGIWSQETILRGGHNRTIESLTWTQDPGEKADESGGGEQPGRLRLFSIGLSPCVTEWDLETGVPVREANSNFGDIWCLSAQPRPKDSQRADASPAQDLEEAHREQCLAAGCSDGTIVLFSTEDGDLKYLRTVGRPTTKRPRILSLAWKDRNTLVAGYADSTIRIYDVGRKAVLRNMSLGKPSDESSGVLVWSVKCLPDGTIVSGDSTGELKIWDSRTYSLLQRIKAHEADVLDVAVSGNGDTIVSGGADRRTAVYRLIGDKKSRKPRKWAEAHHRRFHRHDVKSLAIFESKEISVLVSGGLDTVPVLVPLREWNHEYQRSLPNLPQSPPVSSAPMARLFVVWWDREINIWRQHKPPDTENALLPEHPHENSELACRLLLRGEENITAAQLSEDGRLLAVATNSSIKIFQLKQRKGLRSGQLRVRQLEVPVTTKKKGGRRLAFSPDGRWLCITQVDGDIMLARLRKDPKDWGYKVLSISSELHRPWRRTRDHRKGSGSLGSYESMISSIAYSSDSRMIAVADISGSIDTWTLEGQEELDDSPMTEVNGGANHHRAPSLSGSESDDGSDDEKPQRVLGQRWIPTPSPSKFPNLNVPVLFLSFRPLRSTMAKTTAIRDIGVHPTRHNPHPHSHDLPPEVEKLVAVTAHNHLFEFDVTKGKLSDWARRNPASHLPGDFTRIKNRSMGCFWDLTTGQDRLFLYGASWIYMFDMNQDLPTRNSTDGEANGRSATETTLGKRKRQDELKGDHAIHLHGKTRNTGAGDAVREDESYGRLRGFFKKHTNLDEDGKSISLTRQLTPTSDDDEDDRGDAGLSVARVPGGITEINQAESSRGQLSSAVNGVDSEIFEDAGANGNGEDRTMRATWHTHGYRSILGIVPLNHPRGLGENGEIESGDNTPETEPVLEVVIIERPLWDVDLPPRYDGEQDWDT